MTRHVSAPSTREGIVPPDGEAPLPPGGADVVWATRLPVRTTDDLLDAFLERALLKDTAAAPSAWGEKVGFSVFDEDEVLGPTIAAVGAGPPDWIAEILDELEQTPGWYDDFDDEGLGSDSDEGDARAQTAEVAEALAGGALPRAARSALSFCCAYRLGEDLPDACPICLEDLACGQEACRLPCTHIFHGACVVHSFSMRRARILCPLCRCDIKRIAVASPEEISTASSMQDLVG